MNLRSIFAEGLWHNNPGLTQLLGLCPLLAVSNSLINALGMALATLLVLLSSNLLVSLSRPWLRPEIRIPAFVLIIASAVTFLEIAMSAWFYGLYKVLGIFIPLIVTNCIIIGRAEARASRVRPVEAAWDALAMGAGFGLVLILLGSLREIFGQGTLLSNAHLIFGEGARTWVLSPLEGYDGILLLVLPPGAFLCLGLLIAAKNLIDLRLALARKAPSLPAGSAAAARA